MIAITLLVVILIPTSQLLARGVSTTAAARLRVVAANLASQQIEVARSEPFTTLAATVGSPQTTSQTVGGINFTVTQTAQFTAVSIQSGTCTSNSSGNGTPYILAVSETVSWTNEVAVSPVSLTTLVSPPAGYFQSSTGQVAAQVTGADGTARTGIPVTLTGPAPGTQTATVNSTGDGCAFFVGVTPGSYTVSLSQAGYVSDQEATSPSQTLNVTSGQTAGPVLFSYDQATTLNFQFPSVPAPATNLPVSIGNSHLQPVGWLASPLGATSWTPLYPFVNGYSVWAGDCEEANPQGTDASGNPLYPGATPPSPINAPAGTPTTAPVSLFSLVVNATSKATGLPVTGATVTALQDGVNCPSDTYGLSTTDTNGNSSSGVPYGQFKLTVTSGASSSSVYVWVTPTGVLPETSGGQADPTGTPYSGAVPVQL